MTTKQEGIAIEPIIFPLNSGTAVVMKVLILNFATNAKTANTYYQLLTEDNILLREGNYTLTEEEFALWGQDNNDVNIYLANFLGVKIK